MPGADRTAVAWRLAAELARSRTEAHAAVAVSRASARVTGAEVVRVWMIDRSRGYRLAGCWPEEGPKPEVPSGDVARAVVLGSPYTGAAEGPFRSRLTLPLVVGHRPLGAIELLEQRRPDGLFSDNDAEGLSPLAEAADAALAAGREETSKEAALLSAISRLTRLFDIGTSITSTLEMNELPGVIVQHLQAALEVDGAYLWLRDDAEEGWSLAAAAGVAADAMQGWQMGEEEGVVGWVASSGEALLIDDPEEIGALEDRPDRAGGLDLQVIAAVPVLRGEERVEGVIEVVNARTEPSIGTDDLHFLKEVARTTALALENARRLDAERRAGDLGALLEAAQELSSTLEVPKVSFTLVHKAASVLRYRRAAVGLIQGARMELAAVSGQTFVDETLPEMKALKDILIWAAGLEEGLYVVQEDDGTIETDRPETREKFRAFFEQSGHRSFLSVPLEDEDGRLGVFALEASEPYAFSERALEAASLLAVQATVAIRNATLYQQIPMARVMRPLAGWKERFQRLPRRRQVAWLAGLVVAGAILLAPVPLRISGDARVLPAHRVAVTTELEGRLFRVFVREGDRVEEGQVLAQLDDTDYRVGREDAKARYEVALREQSRLRADAQTGAVAVQAARIEGLGAELELWETRLEATKIRSRVAGFVATPRIEELEGTALVRGDVVCEVVDPINPLIEVAVPEQDAGLLSTGMPVKVKLYAYPTTSFRGRVEQIGIAATLRDYERVFLVRARLEDASPPFRPEMTGQAKIGAGYASLARVFLRRPARWIWGVIWGWLP